MDPADMEDVEEVEEEETGEDEDTKGKRLQDFCFIQSFILKDCEATEVCFDVISSLLFKASRRLCMTF